MRGNPPLEARPRTCEKRHVDLFNQQASKLQRRIETGHDKNFEIKTLAATKTWGRGRVYDSITETIGHTPLVRLSKIKARQTSTPTFC